MPSVTSVSRRLCRGTLACVLALVTVPLLTTSASAAVCDATDPCVKITYVNTVDGVDIEVAGPFTYSIRQNPALVEKPVDYEVRTKPMGKRKSVRSGGIPQTLPLPELFKQARDDDKNTISEDVTFSETPGVRKVPAVLDSDYLDGSATFAGGLVPAVYATDDGRVGYVRPLLPRRNDVNAAEVFTTKPGSPLKLTFHVSGRIVSAKIKASPDKPTTAGPVSFSAEISPETDETFEYEWNFVGKSSPQSEKAAPTYQYKKTDTYAVNLTLRGRDGSYGRASTATVKVGKPPKAPTSGTGGGSGSGTVGGGDSGYIPPYDPGVVDPPSDTPPEEDVPDDEPTEEIPVDDGLEEVEGYVLAGAEIVPGGVPEAIPGTQDSAEAAPATQASTPVRIATWVVAALALVVLVGAGAVSETRWFRHRLRHLRRRA